MRPNCGANKLAQMRADGHHRHDQGDNKWGAEAVYAGQLHVEQQCYGQAETHGQHDETDRVNGCHF